MSNKAILCCLLAGISFAAQAEDAASSGLTGNAGFGGGYTFRGISQHYRASSLQGGFGYHRSGGLYAGTWGSDDGVNRYAKAEWDVYGGYNGKANGGASHSPELNYAIYTGGRTLLLHGGRQKAGSFHLLSHADYKTGVAKPLGSFTLGAAYTRTDAVGNNLYHVLANGEDRNLRGGVLAPGVNRSF